MLPFTVEQFFAVFAKYNEVIWPVQIAAVVVGFATLWFVFRGSGRWVSLLLAMMWLWTGIAYHLMQFSSINGAAYGFGALFVLQALALLFFGAVRGQLHFSVRSDGSAWLGLAMVAYSMVLYPLIGIGTGHEFSEVPFFGVTPCPVTIFTLGVFLLTSGPVPWTLQLIPVVWSLIGGSAAVLLNVPQDWVLLLSGAITAVVLLLRDRPQQPARTLNSGRKKHQGFLG